MNKVICNLCGTSYPENASQCPICGEARQTEPAEKSESTTYTYVKGGRFSKANVKKRNRLSSVSTEIASENAFVGEEKKKKNAGLIVVFVILLLAIFLVAGYIAVKYILPTDVINSLLDKANISLLETTEPPISENDEPSISESTPPASNTEATEALPDLSCTAIALNLTQIDFNAIGAKTKLIADLEPVNTDDTLAYSSADTSIATVSEDGTVTAVAEGNTEIIVTCGSVSVSCKVSCVVPTETSSPEFSLNRKEITFDQEGQTWLLYDGEIALEDIVWTSDNNEVAEITNGKVTAVSNGDTTVYGIYGGETVSCIIHCVFSDEGQSGGISEADGTENKTYKLYNPYGYADDVTIYVGDQFTLQFVDENENEVEGAQWVIGDDTVCTFEDGVVEATGIGTTDITFTYEGISYTCTVRVIESE